MWPVQQIVRESMKILPNNEYFAYTSAQHFIYAKTFQIQKKTLQNNFFIFRIRRKTESKRPSSSRETIKKKKPRMTTNIKMATMPAEFMTRLVTTQLQLWSQSFCRHVHRHFDHESFGRRIFRDHNLGLFYPVIKTFYDMANVLYRADNSDLLNTVLRLYVRIQERNVVVILSKNILGKWAGMKQVPFAARKYGLGLHIANVHYLQMFVLYL